MGWLGAALSFVKLAGASGEKNSLKDQAKEQELIRPKIGKDINQDQNLALIKSDLANGISGRADKAYNDIVDREFSSSLSSLLKGGGDINSVGDIYGDSEEGRQKLTMFRDNLRLNQIRNLMEQSQITDSRNTVTPWQVNEDAPWKDKTQAIAEARKANAKEYNDAFNSFISSAGGAMGSGGGGSLSVAGG